MTLRPFQSDDLDALYTISLATGHEGGDASSLYADPRLIGHIYVAPYVALEPSLALVATEDADVVGYVVGVLDTSAWEARLEEQWWPALRRVYPDPGEAAATGNPDQRRASMIHRPSATPTSVVQAYPAHLHINLLPRAQGQGMGTRLMSAWLKIAMQRAAGGAHVGVNRGNANGVGFWGAKGFAILPAAAVPERTLWMGRSLVA